MICNRQHAEDVENRTASNRMKFILCEASTCLMQKFGTSSHDDSPSFSADYLERVPQLPTYPPGISGKETETLFSGEVPWEGRGAAAFGLLLKCEVSGSRGRPRAFLRLCVRVGRADRSAGGAPAPYCIRTRPPGDPRQAGRRWTAPLSGG